MEKFSTALSNATAALAALAFSLAAISATVTPVDFAAPPVASQEMTA
ncbi:hypothetical protein [Croceicoccus bisphenolivorans]|nr:hypothetical protein [Croceicoccus bisphenolivorans]